jgi:hypothetical protein
VPVNKHDLEKPTRNFLILVVIISTWMVVGNLLEFLITKNNLRHIKGRVSDIRLTRYTCSGSYGKTLGTCEKTEIAIGGFKGYYKIVDRARRDAYIAGIEKGDSVDVYTRKWFQYFCTWGRFRAIYILEKDGEVYYTFEDNRGGSIGFIIVGGAFLLVFGLILYININTRRWLAGGKLD